MMIIAPLRVFPVPDDELKGHHGCSRSMEELTAARSGMKRSPRHRTSLAAMLVRICVLYITVAWLEGYSARVECFNEVLRRFRGRRGLRTVIVYCLSSGFILDI